MINYTYDTVENWVILTLYFALRKLRTCQKFYCFTQLNVNRKQSVAGTHSRSLFVLLAVLN